MKRLSSEQIVEPKDFFRSAMEPLPALLDWLRRDIGMLRTRVAREISYINSNTGMSFDPVGVAVSHQRDAVKKIKDAYSSKDWCIIHWPTVLKRVEDSFYFDTLAPIAIVWHFRELFRRRSEVFVELLERKIIEEIYKVKLPLIPEEKLRRGVRELSEPENLRYYSLISEKFGAKEDARSFYYAVNRSFRETLFPRGMPVYQPDRKALFPHAYLWHKIKEDMGISDELTCLCISLAEVKERAGQWSMEGPAIKGIPEKSGCFGPKHLDEDTREFCVAEQLCHPDFGIARVGVDTLAINLKQFIKYRAPLTSYYKKLCDSRRVRYGDINAVVNAVRDYWENTYSNLFLEMAELKEDRYLTDLWGEQVLRDVVLLDILSLDKRRTRLKMLEKARKIKKEKQVPVDTYKKIMPRLYVLESPTAAGIYSENASQYFVIRRAKGTYWGVPWDIPKWARHDVLRDPQKPIVEGTPVEDLPRKEELKKGIIYVEGYDRYFYTYKVLVSMRDIRNPVRQSRNLREWMQRIERSSPKEFRIYYKGVKKEQVDIWKRECALKKGKTLSGVAWTRLEDNAIRRYYRPGMTFDDEEELLRICKGRSMYVIGRRAAKLRRIMLSQGIYSLELLPHLRYTWKLQRQINEMKEEAEKRIAGS